MKHTKIAIIGAGAVGSTTAYALLLNDIGAEIILSDIDEIRCQGEIYDLSDAISFCGPSEIRGGSNQEAAQADIIIIAAGKKQMPGQSRTELLATNKQIVSSIFTQLKPLNPHAIVIMVTNPVDLLTFHAQQISGLPRHQVFGSGTFLDTQRLRVLVSDRIGIAEQSIHAYILGEHGDTQFAAWSCARVGGVPLIDFPEISQKDLDKIELQTKQKAYEIIKCKGATYYGIATCVAAMCRTIIFNQRRITPLSYFVNELDTCLSVPVILGEKGVQDVVTMPLNQQEQEKLEQSANALKKLWNGEG